MTKLGIAALIDATAIFSVPIPCLGASLTSDQLSPRLLKIALPKSALNSVVNEEKQYFPAMQRSNENKICVSLEDAIEAGLIR